MTDFTPGEILSILIRRRELIDSLRRGNTDKRELADRLDISRPTIDRAFRELEEYGLISSNGTDYELTQFGRLVDDELVDAWENTEKFMSSHDLLRQLSSDLEFPPGFFKEGEIHLSNPKAPAEPFQFVWDLLEESGEFVALLPVMKPEYVRRFHDMVVEQGTAGEIILEEGIVEILFANYRELVTDLLEIERCSLRRTERAIPFGLIVIDGSVVWAGFYGPAGGLVGAVVNESETVVTWGRNQFESFRERGDPVMTRGIVTHRGREPRMR